MASTPTPEQSLGGTAKSSTPSRLFDLPRELRHEIYRAAFVDDEETIVKIMALEKWMDDERSRRRSYTFRSSLGTVTQYRPPLVVKPIPICPLRKMIVSKQFFEEATEAWLRYKIIQCDDLWTFNKFCRVSRALNAHITKFVCTWNQSALPMESIYPGYFASLKRCSSLRELTVTVTDRVFDIFENRLACVHDFQLAEFDDVMEVENFLEMPSLVSVKLVAHPSELATSDKEKEQWLKNVAAFDTFIKEAMLKANKKKAARENQQKIVAEKQKIELTNSINAKAKADSKNRWNRFLRYVGWRKDNENTTFHSDEMVASELAKMESIRKLRSEISGLQIRRGRFGRGSRLNSAKTVEGRVRKPDATTGRHTEHRWPPHMQHMPVRQDRRPSLIGAGVGLAVVLSTANSVALWKLLSG